MTLTVTLAGLAASNVLCTLAIQWYIITQLGLGNETDALYAGIALPQLLINLAASSLTLVLVPLLVTRDDQSLKNNVWALLVAIGGVSLVVALFFFTTAQAWVPWLVPGFSIENQSLTMQVARIQLLTMTLSVTASVPISAWQARRKFVRAELSSLLSTFAAMLLLVLLLPHYGVLAAAWGLGLRAGLQLLWLLPGVIMVRWPDWTSLPLGETWRHSRRLLFSGAYYQTDTLLDRFLTSASPAGGLSSLYLGQQLYGAANIISDKAIATPMTPILAAAIQQGDWHTFKSVYRRRLLLILAPNAAVYFGLVFVGQPVLRFLVGYGGITEENVGLLWLMMIALGGFYLGGVMGQVTSRTFYAMGDTKTPTRLTILLYSIYLPVKIFIFFSYGLIALGITISMYLILSLLFQIVILERLYYRRAKQDAV
jgi:putative peptidoglycan lipid II flippase